MILFWNEERAYISWIRHHRMGFVLDMLRRPSKGHAVIHRAMCPEIRHASSKRTRWTTGRRLKACSLGLNELIGWAEGAESPPSYCHTCTPDGASYPADQGQDAEVHLTRLDREILSFVLEIATCHLDDRDHPYALTVGMVCQCLGKTSGQLAAAFGRLVADRLLTIQGGSKSAGFPSPRCRVFPTSLGLRTLPAFAALTDRQLEAELRLLGYEEVAEMSQAR